MRSLKIILLLGLLPLAARADDVLVTRFAECAGRLSAEMEHTWLMRQPSETIETERRAMIALLDAVRPADRGPEILNIRIGAKLAHAALLQRATFNRDATDARWAATRAEIERAHCTALVLS